LTVFAWAVSAGRDLLGQQRLQRAERATDPGEHDRRHHREFEEVAVGQAAEEEAAGHHDEAGRQHSWRAAAPDPPRGERSACDQHDDSR